MNKKIKHILLDLLVILVFFILAEYVEIEAFSFSAGAVYVILLDIIDMWFRD